jgi:threonine synthase
VPRSLLIRRHRRRSDIAETKFADIIPDERIATIARNLKHGFPPDAHSAMHALHTSAGRIISVADQETLAAQRSLASQEGIFCEPSAAVCLAAIERATKDWIISDECTVGLITGSGSPSEFLSPLALQIRANCWLTSPISVAVVCD